MTDSFLEARGGGAPGPYAAGGAANLADILERVLDRGVVIAGDIRINLLDIELLTIKLRLVVASVDKAKEMGIDWWEDDPALSTAARRRELTEENARLRERLAALEGGPGREAQGAGEERAGRGPGTPRPGIPARETPAPAEGDEQGASSPREEPPEREERR